MNRLNVVLGATLAALSASVFTPALAGENKDAASLDGDLTAMRGN